MSYSNKYRFLSWNVTGLMSSSSYLCELLNSRKIDFCGLSEHWLYNHNLHFIDAIDNNYKCHAIADYSLDVPSHRRVGKGGVALMWHINYDRYITPLSVDDDRIVGVQFQVAPQHYLFIFQLYLPCRNHSISIYKDYIDKLYNLWSMYSINGTVVFMGDFNSNCLRDNNINTRDGYFKRFLRDTNFVAVNTLDMCSGAQNTFVSYDNRCETLIDYILVPTECTDAILHCEIVDDNCLNVSRHRPVYCCLEIHTHYINAKPTDKEYGINWKKIKQSDIYYYQELLKCSVDLNYASNSVLGTEYDVDNMYKVITNTLTSISESCLPKSKFKHHLKPYWNTELSCAHKSMTEYRTVWINDDRPRGNNYKSYKLYKIAKSKFRKLHRYHAQLYLNKLDEEIDRTAEIDQTQFWKLINKRRKSKSQTGAEIKFNGVVYRDQSCITNQWQKYFQNLYTPSNNCNYNHIWKSHVDDTVSKLLSDLTDSTEQSTVDCIVTNEQVQTALNSCKRGKACGIDNVYYEHLIFGGDIIIDILSKLYSAMLKLSYTPPSMNKGIIVTIHKGGKKPKNDPNNYRAITLSPTILKIYENVLLLRCKSNIIDTLNIQQGGFQENLGCTMTSFSLRECILYGKENHSNIFTCFLDARQAFDRVWHNGLLLKLLIQALTTRHLWRLQTCIVT